MGLSLRNIGKKLLDVAGGVERQLNPFDNNQTYSNPQGNAPQQAAAGVAAPSVGQQVKQQAQSAVGGLVKPFVQFPLDLINASQNLADKAANNTPALGANGVGTGRYQISPQTIQQNFNTDPFSILAVNASGATGTNKQLSGTGAIVALNAVAPGVDSALATGAAKLAAPSIVRTVAPRLVGGAFQGAAQSAASAFGEGATAQDIGNAARTGAITGAASGLIPRTTATSKSEYVAGEGAARFKQAQANGTVFTGADAKPRFEGNDSTAQVRQLKPGFNDSLGNVLVHPNLYHDYPQLQDVKVSVQALPKGAKAVYLSDANHIVVSPKVAARPSTFKDALLHETQHAIQNVEGFAQGTNLKSADAYRSNLGEIEARQVQARAGMTPEQRTAAPLTNRPVVQLKPSEMGSKAAALKAVNEELPQVKARNNGGLRDQLGEAFIDKDAVLINQFKNIEKQTGEKGLVKQLLFNTNMVRQSPGIATHDFTENVNVQNAVAGLSKGDYKDFVNYSAARRELANARDGLKTSRPVSELEQTVAQHDQRFGQNYDSLNQYYKGLAAKAHAAGIIDDTQLAQYAKDNDYIRLQRDMGDLQDFTSGGRNYSLRSTKLDQKRTGSTREVLDPVHTALARTQEIQAEIQKNIAAQHIATTLADHGLANEVTEAASKHKNVISFRDNGTVRFFQVEPEIKRVVNNIAPFRLNSLERVVGAPARVLRAGATALNPVFTAANILKDELSSAVVSSKTRATHTPTTMASGIKNSASDFAGLPTSPLYKEYIKRGGDRTQYDLTRNAKGTAEVVNRLRGGRAVGFKQAMLHPIRTLEDANAITEKATRFQNFKGIYEDSIKQGKPHETALQDATMAALEHTVNFSRAGSWGRIINLAIPYSNASIQGGRTLANAVKARPFSTTSKGFAWVGTPIAAATLWNTNDPERKKIYDNISDYEKNNNIILIKPGTKYGDVRGGNYGVIKIPLPPDIGNVFQPIRRAIEQGKGGKKVSLKEIATSETRPFTGPVDLSSKDNLISSITPQAAKPLVNQAQNKDLYTGKQIVPDYLRDSVSDPTKRSTKATSIIAKKIANATGIEPVRVDKFVTDTTGKLGSIGINAVDTGLVKLGQGKPSDVGGQNIGSLFSQRFANAVAKEDPNNETAKYYKKVSDQYNQLDKNEKAAFDTVHTSKIDGNQPDKTLYDASVRAGIYAKYPKVLAADNAVNKDSNDPFYKLPPDRQKTIISLDSLSNDPGGNTAKEITKQNPWLKDYYNQRGQFFDQLAASGQIKGTTGNNLPKSPTVSSDLQTKLDSYGKITDSTQKRDFLTNNSDVSDYFSQSDQYQRQKRAVLGLPQFDQYPTAPPDVQKKLDIYSKLPQHDGKKGGNATRAAYLQANPDVGDYFGKVSQYGVVKDAQTAIFEGEDLSSKSQKALSPLANPYSSGATTSGTGYKSSSSYKDARYLSNAAKFMVSAPSGKVKRNNIRVSLKKASSGKFKVRSIKPQLNRKVSLKAVA